MLKKTSNSAAKSPVEPATSQNVPGSSIQSPASQSQAASTTSSISFSQAVVLMITAACLYTLSNICVRYASEYSRTGLTWNSWLIFHRSLPVFLLCWFWMGKNYFTGQWPNLPLSQWGLTFLAGCLLQLGGDVNFQLSLTNAGLATAIPVNMCSVLIVGAIFSRFWLNEPLTLQSLFAQGVLMVAITIIGISRGGQPAEGEVSAIMGIIHGLISGLCYGTGGVILRYLSPKQPILFTIFLVTLPGTPIFGLYGGLNLGFEQISQIPWYYWAAMWGSGFANCSGFYLSLTATRRLPIVVLNSISSSQIMMSTMAGILLFQEPVSSGIIVGIMLSILGLVLLSRKNQPTPKDMPLKIIKADEAQPANKFTIPSHTLANTQSKNPCQQHDLSIPA